MQLHPEGAKSAPHIVLHLGLKCHICKSMGLIEKISDVNDDVLLTDTTIAKLPGSFFKVAHERLDNPKKRRRPVS